MENYMDFLNGEVRYNSLQRQNPEKAARLFAKNESEAQARYEYLQKLITLYGADEKIFFEGEIREREKSRFLYSVYDGFCGDFAGYLWLLLF